VISANHAVSEHLTAPWGGAAHAFLDSVRTATAPVTVLDMVTETAAEVNEARSPSWTPPLTGMYEGPNLQAAVGSTGQVIRSPRRAGNRRMEP
jgi:hypothetical protein